MWISRRELKRILSDSRKLETKVLDLEQQLHDERDRNRRREDDLLNQCLLATGRYGIEPAKPKPKPEPVVKQRPRLNAVQEATRAAYHKAALEAGRTVQDAEAVFWAEIEGKPSPIPSPDELYTVPV